MDETKTESFKAAEEAWLKLFRELELGYEQDFASRREDNPHFPKKFTDDFVKSMLHDRLYYEGFVCGLTQGRWYE